MLSATYFFSQVQGLSHLQSSQGQFGQASATTEVNRPTIIAAMIISFFIYASRLKLILKFFYATSGGALDLLVVRKTYKRKLFL